MGKVSILGEVGYQAGDRIKIKTIFRGLEALCEFGDENKPDLSIGEDGAVATLAIEGRFTKFIRPGVIQLEDCRIVSKSPRPITDDMWVLPSIEQFIRMLNISGETLSPRGLPIRFATENDMLEALGQPTHKARMQGRIAERKELL